MPSGWTVLKVTPANAVRVREHFESAEAVVAGRRHVDDTDGWGSRHPMDVPVFVVTHTAPRDWIKAHEGAPFTFGTDGVASAIEQARAVAGDKVVGVGGANVAQQAIRAGLIDEPHVDLVPDLLGQRHPVRRPPRHRADRPGDNAVVAAPGVTHRRLRVVKR